MPPRVLLAVTALALLLAASAHAAPGDLDTTFGDSGIAEAGSNSRLHALALQADGKIIAAGTNRDILVARLNANGTDDTTFGSGNNAASVFSASDLLPWGFASASAVAVQPDGKIIAAGGLSASYDDSVPYAVGRLLLVRFRADGTLDAGFGENGSVLIDAAGPALAVALQSDGKIVTGGPDFTVMRFLPDGRVDSEFGTNGMATADTNPTDIAVRTLSVQSDGRIIVAGTRDGSDASVFAVRRYQPNGCLDGTFGTQGSPKLLYTTYSWPGMAIAPDGKVLIVGDLPDRGFGQEDFALARYQTDGTPDSTFGAFGLVTTDFGDDEHANAVTVQSDGRILVAGVLDGRVSDGPSAFAVARYEANGSLDGTFGSNGTVTTTVCGRYDDAYAVVVQPDGNIVVGGTEQACGSNDTDLFAVVRYVGVSCNDQAGGCASTSTTTTTVTTSSSTAVVSTTSTSDTSSSTSTTAHVVPSSTSTTLQCVDGLPGQCEDGDPCTLDHCDPLRGCISEPDPAPDSACLTEGATVALQCAPPRLTQRLLAQFQRAVGCLGRCDQCRRPARDAVLAFRRTAGSALRAHTLSPECAAQLRALVVNPCAPERTRR